MSVQPDRQGADPGPVAANRANRRPNTRSAMMKTSGFNRAARTLIAALAVLVTSLGALTGALGAGPASAAAAGAVTWHKLTLRNGWASSQGQYDTGNPSWAVQNGVVYLSGSAHQAAGTDPELAVLPQAARPARYDYISVYTVNGTTGYLYITPKGRILAYSLSSGNAQDYISLAGVSFLAAGTTRHTLHLINGWHSAEVGWSTGDPAYAVRGGVVYLSGAMQQLSGTNDSVAYLPKAAWPAHMEYITVFTYGGTTEQLVIYPGGLITAVGSEAPDLTSLTGVSFPAAMAVRHKLILINGWHSAQDPWNTGDPSYAVAGGVVYLSGSLTQQDTGSAEFAVLPKAARPSHYLFIQTSAIDGTIGTVEITPGGQVWAYSQPANNAIGFTSLAAISYPSQR